MSILTETWHTWYFGGVDSESRLRFLKFRPQNPFGVNLGPKIQSCPFCLKIGTHCISRMLILIPTLVFWISNPISFPFFKFPFWANLRQKSQSCPFKLKIGTHGILEMQIPNLDLYFWNSVPKIHFWANLGQKSQSCTFFLKIGTHGISTMLILIPTSAFWISSPKSIFEQIWAKKVKVAQFGWKLAHRVSQWC